MTKNEIGKTLLKPERNILQLMMKANKSRNEMQNGIHNLPKNATFSLPKLKSKDEDTRLNSIYCHILCDITSEYQNPNQDPLITTCQKQSSKFTNQRISFHRSSLSIKQDSDIPNKDFINKYIFSEISQDSDFTYFFKKAFEPEIALFMNGANKVLAVVSQNSEERMDLRHISNYIMKTNNQIEKSKRRIYTVKYSDKPSFQLSEKVDFRNSSLSIITPKSPPISYLFIVNLIDMNEITCFAEIIKKVQMTEKKGFQPKLNFFKELCQIARKSCSISTILFIRPFHQQIKSEKEIEKLAKLFCQKKKSFFIEKQAKQIQQSEIQQTDMNSSKQTENALKINELNEIDQNQLNPPSNEIDINSNGSEDEFNQENDLLISPIDSNQENNLINSQFESNQIDDSLTIKQHQTELSENNLQLNTSQKSTKILLQKANSEFHQTEHLIEGQNLGQNTLFELLKSLNTSERNSREKADKINSIRKQISQMKSDIELLKEILNEYDQIEIEMKHEIDETQSQAEILFHENESMKKKIREMIQRTGQLKTKYRELLSELREQDENVRLRQMEILTRKKEELRSKVEESESKWRKEVESRRKILFHEKENIELNNNI